MELPQTSRFHLELLVTEVTLYGRIVKANLLKSLLGVFIVGVSINLLTNWIQTNLLIALVTLIGLIALLAVESFIQLQREKRYLIPTYKVNRQLPRSDEQVDIMLERMGARPAVYIDHYDPQIDEALLAMLTVDDVVRKDACFVELKGKLKPDVECKGSRILQRRLTLEEDIDQLASLLGDSMEIASKIDKNCTLQLGSSRILKYTASGLKYWRIPKGAAPIILNMFFRRSIVNIFTGQRGYWIVKGHLEDSILKASTTSESEDLTILHRYEESNGISVFICKEPLLVQNLTRLFREKIYIYATRKVTLAQQEDFVIRSEVKDVRYAYFKTGLHNLVPSSWKMHVLIGGLLGLIMHASGIGDVWFTSKHAPSFEQIGLGYLVSTTTTNLAYGSHLGALLNMFNFAGILDFLCIPLVMIAVWLCNRFPDPISGTGLNLPLLFTIDDSKVDVLVKNIFTHSIPQKD